MQRSAVPALAWFTLAACALFWGLRLDSARHTTSGVRAETGPAYGFLAANDAGPSTWDCTKPIRVVVNDQALAPTQRRAFSADLAAAFSAIRDVSPFEFVLVGNTTAVPTRAWGATWDDTGANAPVIVAVAPTEASDLVVEHGAAAGGSFYRSNAAGALRSYAGYVMIELEDFDSYRQGSGYMSHQTLLLHELLHVLNLGHVEDHSSVLTERISDSAGDLGSGDIAGLAILAAHGCPSRS